MAKITSKLQVTIPKRIADQYGLKPGDDIEFVPAGEGIHLLPGRARSNGRFSLAERLRLFNAASVRQREREQRMNLPDAAPTDRDWRREDLYTRGESD